ncbi:MAG: CotH kinase family protein [bacterium]|nr:CotH kinase family protein [bacterium]MCM1423696.1 CotH kinase family protein [bacterium]
MRSIKNVALCGAIIVFGVLAGGMAYFMNADTKEDPGGDYSDICINEVCSDYFPTSFSETQPGSDWIELYNPTNESKNLKEYYLSDDKDDLQRCNLPAVELMPGCFYVIHSETEEMAEEDARLNFKINAQSETLYLSSREGVIDIVDVPALTTNTSWSRKPDGAGIWENTVLTYHASNNGGGRIPGKTEAPIFSAEGGFYANELELELEALSGSKIYYTLDCSDPDEESTLYDGPIRIRDKSGEPNIYSVRNDFDAEHSMTTGDIKEKITVVRAVAVDAKGRKSDIVTNSYLIGKEDAQCYSEMYTVSLVTDPDHLFDYQEGIYVLGKVFDDYVEAGGDLSDPIQAEANYRKRGKGSERPASLEIYDENGENVTDREVGIRIHGSTTRGCTQKSFSVYAREMYDGKDTIENLFGEGTDVHKFFLYTNREGTKLRDKLTADRLADRDVATQKFIYCNVFLDGEYWGVYLLAEIYDEYYFQNHYGIAENNLQIQYSAYPPDVIEYLSTVSDSSETAVYEKLCSMIDVQSFIEYYASMLYLNDQDWLGYNARCYRSTKTGPGENEDGKWRWCVWDTELTMYDADMNTFCTGNGTTWRGDPLAQALMQHEEFREQFVTTYMDLYNNIWQEDVVSRVVSEMETRIAASYQMYMERYHAGVAINEYCDKLKKFLKDRPGYALQHVKEEFQLRADPAWVVILSNVDGAASFRVNTTVVDMPDAWWQGLYFPDYPVKIAVEEVNGDLAFVGWYTEAGELLSTDRVLTLPLKEGVNTVCPRFEG